MVVIISSFQYLCHTNDIIKQLSVGIFGQTFYDEMFVQISWKWNVRYLVKYYHQAFWQNFYDLMSIVLNWKVCSNIMEIEGEIFGQILLSGSCSNFFGGKHCRMAQPQLVRSIKGPFWSCWRWWCRWWWWWWRWQWWRKWWKFLWLVMKLWRKLKSEI